MTTPGRRDAYRFHNNDAEERAELRPASDARKPSPNGIFTVQDVASSRAAFDPRSLRRVIVSAISTISKQVAEKQSICYIRLQTNHETFGQLSDIRESNQAKIIICIVLYFIL